MQKKTKIKVLLVFILSLSFFKMDGQEKKNTAEIKNFGRNREGKISWEINYTSRELSYQFEFFEKGEWLVNSTDKQSVSLRMPGQKEEYSTRDSIQALPSGRYRLRITNPVNVILQEIR